MISSEDEFGAVGYLAPRSPDGHNACEKQFNVNDSGLTIPSVGYGDCYENSDPQTPTSTHAFFQRTNTHPPLGSPWTNQQSPILFQAPDKYMKVPEYEELPNSARHPDDPHLYTAIDEGSVIVATEKKSQNETNTKGKQAQTFVSTTGKNQRQRTNSLYDQSGGSLVQPRHPPRKDGLCAGGSCYFQTFGFMFALMAFVLALWSLLAGRSGGHSGGHSGGPEYQDLVEEIEGLKSNISKLHFQINFMKSQESYANETFENLKQLSIDAKHQINFLKSQESRANETFENLKQLSNGTKKQMEMRGLANMSACSHKRKSYGRPASFDYTITDPLDLSHVLVLGVLCTTKGGTGALLVDQTLDNNSNYTCICHGIRNGEKQRYCAIHYWTCPIL